MICNREQVSSIFLSMVIFITGILNCNQNPVNHKFEMVESYEWKNSNGVYSIVQDNSGKLFSMNYGHLCQVIQDKDSLRFDTLFFLPNGSDQLIKDKTGAILYFAYKAIIKISIFPDNVIIDTIYNPPSHLFSNAYTTMSNGDLIFLDCKKIDNVNELSDYYRWPAYDSLRLMVWNGINFSSVTIHDSLLPDTIYSINNYKLSVAKDTVYLTYEASSSPFTFVKIVNGGMTTKVFSQYRKNSISVIHSFTQNDKLFCFLRVLDTLQLKASASKNALMINVSEGFILVNVSDSEFIYVDKLSQFTTDYPKLFKSPSDDVYLYNEKNIVKIQSSYVFRTVTSKRLFTECSCLFSDTSGAVVMYDDIARKLVTISTLPGFGSR